MTGKRMLGWLRKRAEDISVLLLLAMFIAFMIQIVSRYVLNLPIGWTHEISVVLWIWLVLFGASFVVRDSEEMRFDLIYASAGDKARRAMALVTAVVLVILFVLGLPAAIDYVAFMKVEKTAYLGIRFDWLYAIYIVFAIAMIVRHLWIGWTSVFGKAPEAFDPTKASSGV